MSKQCLVCGRHTNPHMMHGQYAERPILHGKLPRIRRREWSGWTGSNRRMQEG